MINGDDLKKRFGFNREGMGKAFRDEFEKLTPAEFQRVTDAMVEPGAQCDFPTVEELLEFIRKAAKGEPK